MLEVFQYQDIPVRTVTVEGEPWFVLADLCKVLEIANARNAAARLDDSLKGVRLIDTPGGRQKMTIVSEAGMYEVVIRSDKPEAAAFRRWITSEVLPTIRKTGGYGKELSPQELMAKAVLQAEATIKELEASRAELQPKASAWDKMVSSAGSWSFDEAAKALHEKGIASIGQKRLVQTLVNWKYLFRDHKGRPRVYQRFIEQELFVTKLRMYTDQVTGETKESSAPQVRITAKGLDMLHRRFTQGQLTGLEGVR